jgi:hypothetical protein
MPKIRVALFSFFFLFSILNFGQEVTKKWSFAFQLDNRFSSIRNQEINVFGTKVGFQYKKLTRIGLGSSFIINPVYINYFNKKINKEETNKISFWYFSIFNDWMLYKNNKWECFLTEQIGYGKPSFVKEVNDDVVSDVNVDLYLNEISGQVNYKFTSWIGIGTGFGYRNLFNKKSILTTTFDAPIYIAKVIVYPEIFFKK